MKIFIILISLFFCFSFGCKTPEKKENRFDKTKWAISEGNNYPHRDDMLNDLVYNVPLKGLTYDSVTSLLGKPNRTDGGYLYYRVVQKRIGFFPLHTRSLVIKLDADSLVEWRKIHE